MAYKCDFLGNAEDFSVLNLNSAAGDSTAGITAATFS
jgi:hypothetical protein